MLSRRNISSLLVMSYRNTRGSSWMENIIIIIFIEETFSLTCGFRKGPQRLILKAKISTLNLKKK